jgi:hypothetical protein
MKKTVFLLLFVLAAKAQDTQAIKIADGVIKAMGGTKAYANTRHITWDFFGARRLTWDKWSGNVRIEIAKDKTVYLINVNNKTGKVMIKGVEVVASADSMKKLVKKAEEIWINDSYWLVMPFKLRDPGVSLKYIGKEKTAESKEAEVLEMTFANVGVTPENKYKIYVDSATNLVVQWAYFKKFNDEKPGFVRPWGDYKTFGKILLSGERGDRDLTDINVYEFLPESIYTSFSAADFSQGKQFKPTPR